MLKYEITASAERGGIANYSEIAFDTTSEWDDVLPCSTELILTPLSAYLHKNVQHYSEILFFPYHKARISIHGKRNNNSSFMSKINYWTEVDNNADTCKIENWHKNILKFGTITNTLSRACKINGEMIKNDKL